jgi:hypothetical protein
VKSETLEEIRANIAGNRRAIAVYIRCRELLPKLQTERSKSRSRIAIRFVPETSVTLISLLAAAYAKRWREQGDREAAYSLVTSSGR